MVQPPCSWIHFSGVPPARCKLVQSAAACWAAELPADDQVAHPHRVPLKEGGGIAEQSAGVAL